MGEVQKWRLWKNYTKKNSVETEIVIYTAMCLSLVSHAKQSAKRKIWEVEHNWSKESTLRNFSDCAISCQSSRYISAINIPAQAITRQADIWNMQLKKNLTLFMNLCIIRHFCVTDPSEAHRLFCALIKRKTSLSIKKMSVYINQCFSIFVLFSMMDTPTKMTFKWCYSLKKVIKIPWELF